MRKQGKTERVSDRKGLALPSVGWKRPPGMECL